MPVPEGISETAWSVANFHSHYNITMRNKPDLESLPAIRNLRINLQDEETGELEEALFDNDLVAVAKELADVVYVAYGTAVSLGIDLDAVLRLVHLSNMSKLGEDGQPVFREDGKVVKGPNYWSPEPAIKTLLDTQLLLPWEDQ